MAYVPPAMRANSKLTCPSAVLAPEEPAASQNRSNRVLQMVLLSVLFTAAIPVQTYNLWSAYRDLPEDVGTLGTCARSI